MLYLMEFYLKHYLMLINNIFEANEQDNDILKERFYQFLIQKKKSEFFIIVMNF